MTTTLPARYGAESVDLGFAMAVHRAQGATAHRARVIARDNEHVSATETMFDELGAAERLNRLTCTYSVVVD